MKREALFSCEGEKDGELVLQTWIGEDMDVWRRSNTEATLSLQVTTMVTATDSMKKGLKVCKTTLIKMHKHTKALHATKLQEQCKKPAGISKKASVHSLAIRPWKLKAEKIRKLARLAAKKGPGKIALRGGLTAVNLCWLSGASAEKMEDLIFSVTSYHNSLSMLGLKCPNRSVPAEHHR